MTTSTDFVCVKCKANNTVEIPLFEPDDMINGAYQGTYQCWYCGWSYDYMVFPIKENNET